MMKASRSVRPQKPLLPVPRPAEEELFSPLTVGIIAVAVVAGVIALYSPSLNFQFILDDHRFRKKNNR